MKKDRHMNTYLDDAEKELIEAIETEDYDPGPSLLTPKALREMQEAARNTLGEASTKISICIARSDLARIKARALREGGCLTRR